jgi:hypothetical protein
LTWAEKALRDSEGFYTTPVIQLEKDSYAIVTKPANINLRDGREWISWGRRCDPSDFVTLKMEGYSSNPSTQIFLAIAEVSDIETYLHDVKYDEVTDFRIRRPSLEYTDHSGTSKPEAPTTQTFWTASAYGEGTQTLEWGIEEGTYSLVLMNDDGSQGLDLAVSIGVKVPSVVEWIGVAILVVGLVLLGVAVLMIYLAVRRPKPSKV